MDRALVILHALVSLALAGAATHLALVGVGMLRGRPGRRALVRVYSWVVGALYPLAFVLGLVVYPAYRYRVAGLYLNHCAPWAHNLFEIKEGVAALGLPLSVGLLVLGTGLDPHDAPTRDAIAFTAIAIFLFVAFALVAGLVVSAERSL